MSLQSSKRQGRARLAVFGASTDEGERLRDALAARGVPGSRVDLFGADRGDVQLGEYAGEARLIQEPDLDELAGYDVIFLCERGNLAEQIAATTRPDVLIIDLLDVLPRRADSPCVRPGIDAAVAGAVPSGRFVVPHALSLLIGELLQPIDSALGLIEATAVVLQPASDFGQRGIEELRRQTVELLNFSDASVEVFGRQLAFNLIPGDHLPPDGDPIEQRIEREVGELLGWETSRFSLRRIAAPLFHGHGIQLRVRLGQSCDAERLRQLLARADASGPNGADPPATPLELSGRKGTSVASVSADGLGGYWLWAVAGETASRGTDEALRLAERLGRL